MNGQKLLAILLFAGIIESCPLEIDYPIWVESKYFLQN